MYRYMALDEAACLLERAIEQTIAHKVVTYDLARQMNRVTPVSCSVFAKEVRRPNEKRIKHGANEHDR